MAGEAAAQTLHPAIALQREEGLCRRKAKANLSPTTALAGLPNIYNELAS